VPVHIHCRAALDRSLATPELPPLIVIAGATATGKTKLAVALAESIEGAEIVSADSRQVYRGMDIATAKPTSKERAAVPHHGLDLVDPDERFTAADYQRHTLGALAGISDRGGIALLVGGTGLYLRAIAHGLQLGVGDADPTIRAQLEARFSRDGLEPLVEELRQRDPEGAALVDQRNPRRVIRALERVALTGSAVPPPPRGYAGQVAWLGLRLEPEIHRAIIRERIEQHFESGLLDEAQRLRDRFPEDLTAFSAVGYQEAFDVLAGRRSIDEAKESDARRTWAYARRQRTWFRSETDIEWLEAGEGLARRARTAIIPFLGAIGSSDYPEP
jgi:tRNA dimethylallyltransferase